MASTGLPKNVHKQGKTGKFYFEYGKGKTLLIGPQRVSIAEAEADKVAIMRGYAEKPRKFAKDAQAFAAAKAECEQRCATFQCTERGIQRRLGGYLVTRKEDGRHKGSAMRFTFDDAVKAREELLAGRDVEWLLDDVNLVQGSLKEGGHTPVFISFCGPRGEAGASEDLEGRAAKQKRALPSDATWVELQDCGEDHLDERGSFQRCPLRPETTTDTVKTRLGAALASARLRTTRNLAVYMQTKVYHWLFRQSAAKSDEIWKLFEGDPILIGPHFSRLFRAHLKHPLLTRFFDSVGLTPETQREIVETRSKRQLSNAFGSDDQSEDSKRLMGSAGFRQHPENIYGAWRKSNKSKCELASASSIRN